MDYVKAQEDLVDVMESWQDATMAADDPNQPPTFQQAQQQYNHIQDYLRKQQQGAVMDSQADIYTARNKAEAARRADAEPGMWTDTKNYLSDTLGASPLKQFPLLGLPSRWMDVADKAQAGDTIAANLRTYFGDDDVEDALTGVVRGREGAQQGFDALLPTYQKNLAGVEALTDAGIPNIQRAMNQPGMMPGFRQFMSDPVAGASLLAQTLGRSPASAVLGAGGSTIGGLIGGPLGATGGGAGGGAVGGWIDEKTGGIVRMLEEKGFDIQNPEHMQLLQENPEVFDIASDQAHMRAAAIAAFSAIAGGVAGGLGRVAGSPLHALGRLAMPTRIGAAVGSIPAAGVLEGAGEYSAQRAAGQPVNWGDVKLESLMGGVMDTGTTVGGMASGQLAPGIAQLNERTRNLAAKEARIIGEGMPFGGQINLVTGEVFDEDGKNSASAELIPETEGNVEQLMINIDNLIKRSDGTRSGIRSQLMQDIAHELGHSWVQKMITENSAYAQEAFETNEDLILAWQKKSAYGEGQPNDLGRTNDGILYEEWVAQFHEMDTKILRRIELAIVNHLHKLIGKEATAKLIKSWDARNITIRNIAKEHLRGVKERAAAGEVQSVQTMTAEESFAQPRPPGEDVTYGSAAEPGFEEDFDIPSGATQRATRYSRGKVQDPSRRKFMKQAAGAVAGAAVDPSILLEPATPTPPVAPPGFGGFGAGPGIAPEYEAMVKAGEMASPSGLVSDVASRAFDDFDADVALEEDNARQAELEEYDARQAEEAEAETDAERYVETVDEIMNVYDDDASAIEAAQDGTLNDRIISYAAETTFTREELWEGVNERIDALAEDTARPARRFSRARKPKSETVQRDINEEKGKVSRRIAALDVEEAGKEERKNLLKRLQNVMGAKARKRGIDAGDQDAFQEQAAKIVDGDIEAVEAFIKPFEEQLTGGSETTYIADRRRALRAERIGKTDEDILKYRPKGAKHPMEGKMTYPFALEEIDRQEKADEITAEEAEIRRLAVNNVKRIFKNKAGPQVKRTITEAVYGIGAYEDLVPWSEVYTEEQSEQMGERAEVAQAEARRTRYDPTGITDNERKELLKGAVTAEETAWINSDEMPELKTKRERLLFLRAPTEFKSEAEESELSDFRKAIEDKKPYDQKKDKEKRAKETEELISKAMAEGNFTQLPPAEITKITDYQRSVVNVEPAGWDRLRTVDEVDRETAFEMYGDAYTEQGELINESDMELLDPNGVIPRRRESLGAAPNVGDYVSIKWKNTTRIGVVVSKPDDNGLVEVNWNDNKLDTLKPMWRNLSESSENFDAMRRGETDKVSVAALRGTGMEKESGQTKKLTKLITDSLDVAHERDHIINISAKKIDKNGDIILFDDMPVYDDVRPLSIPGNLIPILKEVHSIKGKFEDTAQSAAPYLDITLLIPRLKGLSSDTRIDGVTLQEAEAVKAYRDKLISGLKGFDGDANALAKVYNSAAKAFYKKMGIDKPVKLNKIPADSATLTEGGINAIATITGEFAPVDTVLVENLFRQHTNRTKGRARFSKEKEKDSNYTEHFNDGFWYTITSFLWGKPVQAIRDFNKSSRFGSKQGKITAADKIADLVQRAHSSTKRAEGLELGTDMMQDVSMRSGEFFTKLSRIFALATGRAGDIDVKINKQMTDYLLGRKVKFSSPQVKEAAIELKALLESVYKYGRDSTTNLKERLNLRGEGDTVLPRVWNIEYIATRKGKAAFLRVVNNIIRGRSDLNVTPEDLYEAVINSGGFVQGDWTNVKADQTRSAKDIAKDELIGEVLDSMPTSNMIDEGLVIEDLQALLPRFIQKAIERTEYSRRFGKSDELLRGMIDEALEQIRTNNREVLKLSENKEGLMHIDEKKFTKAVWDMARILRNQYGYDMANMPTRKWLQRATNTETILKLPFVTLASIPEFFTPMLKGDVRPDKWFVDFMAGTAWAGYKGMNGLSKLIFNKHLPAMRKASQDIGGMGIISDVQLLRELGIADIQAMGDLVSTRYANPNFARGGLRGGAKGTLAGKIPKKVRAVFNMQTYMQGTLLTTITEMQQLMALRNFQRHMGRRLKFVHNNKGKPLKGRRARLMKQFTQDLADYGITGDINLDTSTGQAEFNAGALRFIDQVITRPNDATTAKVFKNPLTAPLVLFKRFITVYGNTLMTSIGNDFATKVDNTERAKQVAQVASVAMIMYGSVMFAEIIRGVLKGDLDEEDFKLMPKDFSQFMRRLDRTGLSSAPGAAAINLAFPYKRGWWDTTQSRIMNEVLGPLGGDLTALGDALISGKNNAWERLLGQVVPSSKPLLKGAKKKEQRVTPGYD